MNISDFLKLKNLPTKHLFLLSIICGLILFLPESILESLSLNNLGQPYEMVLGITFLLSFGLVLVDISSLTVNNFKKYRFEKRKKKRVENYISSLNASEMSVVREFYIRDEAAIKLPINDSVVARLIEKGILTQVGTLGNESHYGLMFSLRLSDLAESLISLHHIGIDFKVCDLTQIGDDNIKWLLENRPYYVQ
ncbi:super-infection exclusion protein B [Vibrio sp. DNB22_17_1]